MSDPDKTMGSEYTGDDLEAAAELKEWVFTSRAPVIGRFIAGFREAWNSVSAKWSIRALIHQQSDFNRRLLTRVSSLEYNCIQNDRAVVGLCRRVVEATYAVLRLQEQMASLRGEVQEQTAGLRDNLEEQTATLRADFEEQMASLRGEVQEQTAGLRADLEERMASLHGEVQDQTASLRGEVEALRSGALRQLDELEARVARLERRAREREEALVPLGARLPTPSLPDGGQHLSSGSLDYYLFELRFRGSIAQVKDSQRQYVQYFAGCGDVLDLGCGRGEFLELLREQGVRARGVDLNADMVEACRARGLDAVQADALSYLEELEDNSLGGVFSAHLVEHLPPADLVRLVNLCYRKLKVDAPIVVETPNPTCLLAMATHFAIDPSHVRPVHPETLRFLFTAAGFGAPEVVLSAPVPEEHRLKRLPASADMSAEEAARVALLNQNLDRLNGFLYGHQNYAIISRKAYWPRAYRSEAIRLRQVTGDVG